MWVFLNDAFLSIVHKDCARDELLVRARRPGDIEKIFQKADVKPNRKSDYLYRAVVKRRDVEVAIAAETRRITYSNFKDSVEDRPLHDAYLRVWSTMTTLQPSRPYADAGSFDFGDAAPQAKSGHAGGKARAEALTPERRSEIARNAANARWHG